MSDRSPEVQATIEAAELVHELGSAALRQSEECDQEVNRLGGVNLNHEDPSQRVAIPHSLSRAGDEAFRNHQAANRVVRMLVGPDTAAGEALAAEERAVAAQQPETASTEGV